MPKLKFEASQSHNIRGTRRIYKVTKKVKNIPGFAPLFINYHVCDVVVKFLGSEPPYIQFSRDCPNMISIQDMIEIVECAKKGFVKSDFINLD